MRITGTPREAFSKIQIDIFGPLSVTEQCDKYILTMQDCPTINTRMRFFFKASTPQ